MKKQYIKPGMQVILLKQHSQLLAGSVRSVSIYTDEINDEDAVW